MLSGNQDSIDEKLVENFNQRDLILTAGIGAGLYTAVETTHVETKEIVNVPFGVPGFWLKAMCANKHVTAEIKEKDRAILGYLADIQLEQHDNDFGFDLIFKFDKNSYFNNTELKKSFAMKQ